MHAFAIRRRLLFSKVVIDALREHSPIDLSGKLSTFTDEDWERGVAWLEKQGIQLYFLDTLATLGILETIPPAVRARMESTFAENAARTAQLYDEFLRINDELQSAGIVFCNLLGFALIPVACRNPSLRRQLSIDILMLRSDLDTCHGCFVSLGYSRAKMADDRCEYRLRNHGVEMEGAQVNPAREIRVKIYLARAEAEPEKRACYDMLMRRRSQFSNGHILPAPTADEHLIAHAISISRQLQSGKITLATLLEFERSIRFWSRSDEFWKDFVERVKEHPMAPYAIGVATLIATMLFGGAVPKTLQQFVELVHDASVRPYLEQFGFNPRIRPIGILEKTADVDTETNPSITPKACVAAHDDTELLERICAAYIKATEEEARDARQFGSSPWWQKVHVKHLLRVRSALLARDIPKLRNMYGNFYRDPCGKGLVRRPPRRKDRKLQVEFDYEDIQLMREDIFYRLGCWRTQTKDRYPISVLQATAVGNPFGVTIDKSLIPVGAEFHHACSDLIADLTNRQGNVVEIGGGFGNMAYYLLRANPQISYVDFDVPESLALAAYYLGKTAPDRVMRLYGEMNSLQGLSVDFDIALLPPWEMSKLASKSVELTFASHILSDLIPIVREQYLREISRFTSGLFVEIGKEEADEAPESLSNLYEHLFAIVEKHKSDWNAYRGPEAKEWTRVLRPLL